MHACHNPLAGSTVFAADAVKYCLMEKITSFENWEQTKKQLKAQYPNLTEDDLCYEIGKEEELLKHLEQKLGKTKKEIRNWLHIMG